MKEFSESYLNVLRGTFAGLNLTRILESDEFYSKQILDSIAPYEQSLIFKKNIDNTGRCVDVGFGGGFPILPLAKLLPNISFLGVEKIRKKARAVDEIAKILEISNAKLIHGNLGQINFNIPTVITFKAVGSVYQFLNLINVSSEIFVYFYKGPSFYIDEKKDFPKILENWEQIEEKSLAVKGAGDRILLGFRNKNVLRGTFKSTEKKQNIKDLF